MSQVNEHLVAPRTSEDTQGEVQRVLAKLEEAGRMNLMISLLANCPNGFRPYVLMSNAMLVRSELPPKVREAAILAIAVAQGNKYEWQEHVVWAREVGLSDQDIAAIESGSPDSSPTLTDEQKLAMDAARAIATGKEFDDEAWARMRDTWGEATAMDLCMVAAWWGGFVPVISTALRLDR
jgi:4-carboxymuconolactone decarboxylase